ncbi:MAG: phosphoenolpyruvate carboxykinase [Candidatus Aenigmarchaeota archaeon]|nr:phosphoenolpyruvate carboxykinase [Candidatus Aenigmarchaeota archaeon]
MKKSFAFHGNQAVVFSHGKIPQSGSELLDTSLFREVLRKYIDHLRSTGSSLFGVFPPGLSEGEQHEKMLDLMQKLAIKPKDEVIKEEPWSKPFFRDIYVIDQFVEHLYNYWRSYERFFVCYSENGDDSLDKKPYRTFNETVGLLDHLTRMVYRDIRENITGDHPRIYRQLAAGCQLGMILSEKDWQCPGKYENAKRVPVIRQVYMSPPLILDPPMNKRVGFIQKVDSNPLEGLKFEEKEWFCYPAKVFDTVILVFFHRSFIGIGASLANLFDLADDDDLKKKPDAIYAYGVPPEMLRKYGDPPTVFYDDEKNDILVAAIPRGDQFGYFGYLKKMMLTLHNSVSIKKGRLPVHGAMVRIEMKNGKSANVLLWGDSGAGKSETLEAIRVLADSYIRDMTVIFDDMGSLEIGKDGKVRAYGTETGAFVRLDDLQPGFAFGNMDRTIIHSPQKINARAVIPITTHEEVSRGYEIDFLLYANNYETIDKDHVILERFDKIEKAIEVFRKSERMAKGTTGEKGITDSYYANPFGPLQYRDICENLAVKYFKKIFEKGIFVGQIRTRLGIPGFETDGPQASAKELFDAITGM